MDKPICFDGAFRFDMDCGSIAFNTFHVMLDRALPKTVDEYISCLREAVKLAEERLSVDNKGVKVIYLGSKNSSPFTNMVYELNAYNKSSFLLAYKAMRKIIAPQAFNRVIVKQ